MRNKAIKLGTIRGPQSIKSKCNVKDCTENFLHTMFVYMLLFIMFVISSFSQVKKSYNIYLNNWVWTTLTELLLSTVTMFNIINAHETLN